MAHLWYLHELFIIMPYMIFGTSNFFFTLYGLPSGVDNSVHGVGEHHTRFLGYLLIYVNGLKGFEMNMIT